MDWSMIGAIGELVGAVAVVASLLYVGHQVRQSNRIAKAEAYRDFALAWTDTQRDVAQDPRVAAQFMGAIMRYDEVLELSDEDWAAFLFRCATSFRTYEAIYRQVREGVLDESALGIVGVPFQAATFYKAWEILAPGFATPFREHVEERFRRAKELGPPIPEHLRISADRPSA